MGEQICIQLKALQDVSKIIRSHHEKIDGSGYPDGLRGEDIPLEARIVSIADIFDALTTDRPYRDALEVSEAIRILQDEASQGKLDHWLVEEFLAMLQEM
jgi:putative two-component system response regulator